eukprot:CAMPEP_0204154078 /NCGR_PEP_ID=MMETSP0361-20130328/28413_1 /ASSEMBLY_ACC=CAM_ASM_000343 /TAXON_ID=268821 /ORGANISM="Scrippsiella Hangoei, Strain SHTV-5" /LENGTH=94 /DNA_ID=CAMNT_0051109299 /DNA_START=122 /DNA_END=403 /DNA_ORIENTATION=-
MAQGNITNIRMNVGASSNAPEAKNTLVVKGKAEEHTAATRPMMRHQRASESSAPLPPFAPLPERRFEGLTSNWCESEDANTHAMAAKVVGLKGW